MGGAWLICWAAVAAAQTIEGVLEGTVRDALTGASVSGARASISGCGRNRQEVADDGGKFRAEGLGPCRYQISVRKTGYVGADHGVRPTVAKLEGSRVSIDIPMTPAGTLEGRVLDEDHQPLARVDVYARGGRSAFHVASGRDGRYVLDGLAPGEYRMEVRLAPSIRRTGVRRDPRSGETRGYPMLVAWPAPIAVAAGVRGAGVDFTVGRVLLAAVEGRVIDAVTGEAPAGGQAALEPASGATEEQTGGRRALDSGTGSFRFDLVEPGTYRLRVYRGAGALSFSSHLFVPREGVTGHVVKAPPFGAVSGKATLPEGSGASLDGVSATLREIEGWESVSVALDSGGAFHLSGVPPGRWRIEVSGGAVRPVDLMAALPGRKGEILYAARTRCGGSECPGGVVTVQDGSVSEVVVELSNRTGRLGGTISAGKPEEAESAVALARPEGGSRVYRAPAAAGGEFSFPALPPGVYEVLAVPEDRAAARFVACREKAVRVEVRDRGKAVAQPTLCTGL